LLQRKRPIRGIGTLVATGLLIFVALAAGTAVYSFTLASTVNLQTNAPYLSVLDIPTGSASGDSIKFYVLNLGKQQASFDGNEKAMVTLPNQTQFAYSQVAVFSNEVAFGCGCNFVNGTLELAPKHSILIMISTSFELVPGFSYSILLVLGDGSEAVTTITAQ
jgi:hypothetical protein